MKEKHTFQLEGRDNQINHLKQKNRNLKQYLEETQEYTLQVKENNRVLKSLLMKNNTCTICVTSWLFKYPDFPSVGFIKRT